MATRLKNLRRKTKFYIHNIEKKIINKKYDKKKVIKLLKKYIIGFRLYDKYLYRDRTEYHYRCRDEGVYLDVDKNNNIIRVEYLPF